MKRFLTSMALLFAILTASYSADGASRGMFRFGLDWGYGVTFFNYWNINYLDSEVGYRVWDEDYSFGLSPEAYATIRLGAVPLDWLEISLFSGVMGISEGRKVIPVGLQASLFPGRDNSGRFLLTIGGGAGLGTDLSSAPAAFALIGTGWRFPLNPLWDLDLILRIRACKDAPPIWDEEEQNYVNPDNIRKNVGVSASVEFGIGLSF